MKHLMKAGALALTCAVAIAAAMVVSVVHGTVQTVDSGAKTIAVKTADGAVHTLHVSERLMTRGAEGAANESWRGLKEGSEVVVHYTEDGTQKTAVEIDRAGKDGLKAMDGRVMRVEKGTKAVVVKAADGTEHTFQASDHAIATLGKDTGRGAEHSAKVTVYYTETGGRKVAHFFKHL